MKVYLIRHTEPDYAPVTHARLSGFGRDLSPLTDRGVEIAQKCAESPIFNDVQLILSFPYTRALQTAAEIVRLHDIPLQIELGLHEWLPDLSGTKITNPRQVMTAYRDYVNHNEQSKWHYETSDQIKSRVTTTLARYRQYNCIACVTHSEVIRQLGPWQKIGYGEIKTISF